MRKLFLGLAAISALATAAPAAAQYGQSWTDRSESVERRLDQLRYRIDEGVRRGSINRSEAVRLSDQLWRLRRLEEQYDNGGYSGSERRELERRLYQLRDEVNRAEGYRRGYGSYGRDWAYGDDRWDGDRWEDRGEPRYDVDRPWDEQVYDRDDDGWDDRDRDRDGDWRDDPAYPAQPYPGTADGYDPDGDGYYDNGAPVDPRVRDDWHDEDNDRWDDDGPATDVRAQLRVGDRAPDGLSPVPPEHRDRYRDGNGVYYRYDNGRIYQIEQRSGTIRWIADLPY